MYEMKLLDKILDRDNLNQAFFGVLVMLALVTSWFAGSWLRFVVNKGWRLMPGDEGLVPEVINSHNDITDLKKQIQIDQTRDKRTALSHLKD